MQSSSGSLSTATRSERVNSALDNVIWWSLATKHRAIAQGDGLALRYPASIGPFAAVADTSRASFASLRRLLSPGEKVLLGLPDDIMPSPGLDVVERASVDQMIGMDIGTYESRTSLTELGAADVPEMMALIELTKPGPFEARTHELGRYLGVRVGGQLVAMAGERFHLDGYTELSSGCCHPAYRGRGYICDLVADLSAAILARGEVPILHTYSDNKPAIALGRKMGFSLRRTVQVNVLQRTE